MIQGIRTNICCNRKMSLLTVHFWKTSKHIFNKINTWSVQKPGATVAWNFGGRFSSSIRWKILVIFRYAIINILVQKSLNYQENVSQMERPLVNILYNGSEVKLGLCLIWSAECLIKQVSGSLWLLSFSNETGNPF